MKKTLLYITLPFVALIGATYALPRPAVKGTVFTSTSSLVSTSSIPSLASDTSEASDPKIQAEIKYYLDRHNV